MYVYLFLNTNKLLRLPHNIIYYNILIAIIDPKMGTQFNWFYSVAD